MVSAIDDNDGIYHYLTGSCNGIQMSDNLLTGLPRYFL